MKKARCDCEQKEGLTRFELDKRILDERRGKVFLQIDSKAGSQMYVYCIPFSNATSPHIELPRTRKSREGRMTFSGKEK
jgi:hypothetical protein